MVKGLCIPLKNEYVLIHCSHLVNVPVVGGGVNALPLVALQQLLQVPGAHGASHNLPHTGQQHVHLINTKQF